MGSFGVLAIGIILILLGGFTLWIDIKKRSKCNVEAVAEIIEVKKQRHGSGKNRSTDYSPIVKFVVDGTEHSGMADISSVLPNKFQAGQTLEIKYDPSNPDSFCVKGKIGNTKWCAILLIAGILFMISYFMF